MKSILCVLSALILQAASLPALAGETSPQFAVGLGVDASSGKFGTDSTSTYVSGPFILDWFPTERIDLELTIPLLYQKSQNTGVAALGASAKSSARRNMNGQYSYTGGSASLAGGGSAGDSEFGLGDITLTGGYALLQDSDSTPLIRPTLYLKFPTADDTKGLGTGKFDVGPGVAISKWLGNWQPFVDSRYIFQGASNEDTGARDYLIADAGIGYSWNESFYTSSYARVGSTVFDGMEAPLDIRLKSVWRFAERLNSEAYLLKGLSDGSPDYGGGVAIFVEF